MAKRKSDPKYIDYLDEDPLIPGKKYFLASFVSPMKNQKCDVLGLKISDCCANLEEARASAERLRKINPDFDISVGRMGVWVPFNPDPKKIGSEEYQEETLNELIKGHKENLIVSRQHFNERKRDMIEKAMRDGSKEGQEELFEKKEHPISVKNRIENLEFDLKDLQKRLEDVNNSLTKSKNKLETEYTPEEIESAEKEYAEAMKNAPSEEVPTDNSTDDDLKKMANDLLEKQTLETKIENLSENVEKIKVI